MSLTPPLLVGVAHVGYVGELAPAREQRQLRAHGKAALAAKLALGEHREDAAAAVLALGEELLVDVREAHVRRTVGAAKPEIPLAPGRVLRPRPRKGQGRQGHRGDD